MITWLVIWLWLIAVAAAALAGVLTYRALDGGGWDIVASIMSAALAATPPVAASAVIALLASIEERLGAIDRRARDAPPRT